MSNSNNNNYLRVRDVMRVRGVSGVELAARLGVSTQYISQVCGGSVLLSLPRLYEFAAALGVPASSLLVDAPGVSGGAVLRCPHCGQYITITAGK